MRRPPLLEASPWLAAAGWTAALLLLPGTAWFLPMDDAFYYLEIGRNLAAGAGPTFDRIQVTNGFHPLWQGACALLAGALRLGGGGRPVPPVGAVLAPADAPELGPLVLVLLLQVPLAAAGLVALARSLRAADPAPRPASSVLAAAAWLLLLGGPLVVRTLVNGMETALVVLVHGAWLLAAGETGRRADLRVGLLGALAVLARTDAALLLLALATQALLSAPRAPHGRPPAVRRPGLARALARAGPGAVALFAFLAAGSLLAGTPFQVSGVVKRLPVTVPRLLCALAPLLLTALALRALARRRAALPRLAAWLLPRAWYAAGCALLAGWYLFLQAFPRPYYFAPHLLLGMAVLALLGADLLALRRVEGGGALLPSLLVCGPLALGLLPQVRAAASGGIAQVRAADLEAARWLSNHLPADAAVGSWDAGLVGYVTPQRVVPLDGVVAGPAYVRALRAGRTPDLLRSWGVLAVVNHLREPTGGAGAGYPDPTLADPAFRALLDRTFGPGTSEGVRPLARWVADFSGSTNRGRLEGARLATVVLALPPGG